MEFLANENFPLPSINYLRKAGLNVTSISELYPGISDMEVINKARERNSIILTFDKDYGEIIYKLKLSYPPSVVFFRYKGEDPEYVGLLLISIINDKKIEIMNRFTVIEKENVRQRTY